MSNSKENQEAHEPLPFLPVRWFIFFRLHPHSFLEPTYLFSILFRRRRYPILWDNVMKAEKRRIDKKKDEEFLKNST
jgi:hypothetical protein